MQHKSRAGIPAVVAVLMVALPMTAGCTMQPIQPVHAPAAPAAQAAAPTVDEQEALAVVKAYSDYSTVEMVGNRVAGLAAMYAENAVKRDRALDPSVRQIDGREAIERQMLMDDATMRLSISLMPYFANGGTVVAKAVGDSTLNRDFGLAPLEELVVMEIADGLVQKDTSVLTPDSLRRLAEAVVNAGYTEYTPDPGKDERFNVVAAAMAPWTGSDVTTAAVDESLQYFADDARVEILGMPGRGALVFEGKEQIRTLLEGWVAEGMKKEWTPLLRGTLEIAGLSRTWTAPLEEMGIAPMEATDTFVLKDGLILEEIYALDPASLERLLAALGEEAP